MVAFEEYWYYVDFTIENQYISVYGFVFGGYLKDIH